MALRQLNNLDITCLHFVLMVVWNAGETFERALLVNVFELRAHPPE